MGDLGLVQLVVIGLDLGGGLDEGCLIFGSVFLSEFAVLWAGLMLLGLPLGRGLFADLCRREWACKSITTIRRSELTIYVFFELAYSTWVFLIYFVLRSNTLSLHKRGSG
jgi:hypothetical protein